jgi:hypothetical protein
MKIDVAPGKYSGSAKLVYADENSFNFALFRQLACTNNFLNFE